MPDFWEIIDLINVGWPVSFGKKSDDEKVEEMENSYDLETDTVKYLMEDNKIIGWYRYTLWPRNNPYASTVHTLDLAILPEYQRRGLGTLLIRDIIEDCREKGFNQILSRSFKNNESSMEFHRKMGFHVHFSTDDSIVWGYSVS